MSAERSVAKEDQSLWNSRLFKIGLVTAAVGAIIKAAELITVGVVAVGGAWALWKGKNTRWSNTNRPVKPDPKRGVCGRLENIIMLGSTGVALIVGPFVPAIGGVALLVSGAILVHKASREGLKRIKRRNNNWHLSGATAVTKVSAGKQVGKASK